MKKIAIIGTGIAGMGCGHFLKEKYDISFFEKNSHPGGHTNTVTVNEDGTPVYIDTGFMVYNEVTYPLLTRFFKELNIATKLTSMSFSVQDIPSGLEYCGTGYSGLFAQRKNFFNAKHWRMLLDVDYFRKDSVVLLSDSKYLDYTVKDYVREKGLSEDFLHKFLIPMSSAVWSTPPELMEEFPIHALATFFRNHGFLGLKTQLQWRTVVDGSRVYRDKILSEFKDKVHLSRPIKNIIRHEDKVEVVDSHDKKESFDKVIVASHADEALTMLSHPTDLEKRLLSQFRYQKNKATLHTDSSLMPKLKSVWSSWNYRIDHDAKGNRFPTTIYFMNSLQHVSKKKNYFVSINDHGKVNPKTVLWETTYTHPIYNLSAIKAQRRLDELNEKGPVYFCGSYFKYGFHEDAFSSALSVAGRILKEEVY